MVTLFIALCAAALAVGAVVWRLARRVLREPVLRGRVGPYRLRRIIGIGGMAEAYEAVKDGETEAVVLKVLAPHHVHNPDTLARFRQETEILGRIHRERPGVPVVRLMDFGEDLATGRPYIALEYLRGKSLDRLLARQRPLHLLETCHIGSPICTALEACHSLGIVHRDLSPANIVVSLSGTTPVGATLIDFGVASYPEGIVDTDGVIYGKPWYMSPEQCAGSGVTGASDLYSMGVVLYHMSTGVVPFGAESRDIPEVLAQQREAPPPPLPGSLPATLRSLIESLLRKAPAERPADAGVVRNVLETLALSLSVSPPSPTPAAAPATELPVPEALPPSPGMGQRLRYLWRANQGLPACVYWGLMLVILVCAIIMVYFAYLAGDRHLRFARNYFEHGMYREALSRYELSQRRHEKGADTTQTRLELATCREKMGDLQGADADLRALVRADPAAAGEAYARLGRLHLALYSRALSDGGGRDAETELGKAVDALEKALADPVRPYTGPEAADWENQIGEYYRTVAGNVDRSIEHFTRASERAPDSPRTHANLGVAYAQRARERGQPQGEDARKAMAELTRAIEGWAALARSSSGDWVWARPYVERGLLREAMGDPGAGEDFRAAAEGGRPPRDLAIPASWYEDDEDAREIAAKWVAVREKLPF